MPVRKGHFLKWCQEPVTIDYKQQEGEQLPCFGLTRLVRMRLQKSLEMISFLISGQTLVYNVKRLEASYYLTCWDM